MDRPNPRSLNDRQLASFLGDRPDLIRFFRAFIKYLAESVPDAVDANADAIAEAQDAADAAAVTAAAAQALAVVALQIAQQMDDAPPPFQAPAREPDDYTHILADLKAQIHALRRQVADLQERPTP